MGLYYEESSIAVNDDYTQFKLFLKCHLAKGVALPIAFYQTGDLCH